MSFRQLVIFKQEFRSTGWDLWCFVNASFNVGFRVISAGIWGRANWISSIAAASSHFFPKVKIYLHNLSWHWVSDNMDLAKERLCLCGQNHQYHDGSSLGQISSLTYILQQFPPKYARDVEDGKRKGKGGGLNKKKRGISGEGWERLNRDKRKKQTEGKTGCVETISSNKRERASETDSVCQESLFWWAQSAFNSTAESQL